MNLIFLNKKSNTSCSVDFMEQDAGLLLIRFLSHYYSSQFCVPTVCQGCLTSPITSLSHPPPPHHLLPIPLLSKRDPGRPGIHLQPWQNFGAQAVLRHQRPDAEKRGGKGIPRLLSVRQGPWGSLASLTQEIPDDAPKTD